MIENFLKYLISLGLSSKSLKNYKSDVNHFSVWLIQKIRGLGASIESFPETIPFLKPETADEYKKFLMKNNVPVKTTNRRLSTLRHLSRFLVSSEIINFDFMKDKTNITQGKNNGFDIINDFAKFLESEKVSENTRKNYLSDIRQLFQSLN